MTKTHIHIDTTNSFEELSEEAQENALEKYRDWNIDDSFWHKCVTDNAKELGRLFGVEIENIHFSGFWSQGDGACFEGDYEYKKGGVKALKEYAPKEYELHRIVKALQELQRKNFYKLSAYVKHRGHYYHEMCTDIQVTSDNESMGGANDDAYYGIQELLRDFMRWIYKRLESEYDYLTSKEVIKESLIANECQFNEEGTLH